MALLQQYYLGLFVLLLNWEWTEWLQPVVLIQELILNQVSVPLNGIALYIYPFISTQCHRGKFHMPLCCAYCFSISGCNYWGGICCAGFHCNCFLRPSGCPMLSSSTCRLAARLTRKMLMQPVVHPARHTGPGRSILAIPVSRPSRTWWQVDQ